MVSGSEIPFIFVPPQCGIFNDLATSGTQTTTLTVFGPDGREISGGALTDLVA